MKTIEIKDVDAAKEFCFSGFKGTGVRAKFHGKDGGFCTTSYSYSMSDEAQRYAAARIAILLEMASGLTNEQISQMALKK